MSSIRRVDLGNNVLRPEPEDFQTTAPADQLERYLPWYVENFLAMGYSESESSRLAMEWLPDVLTFDAANPLASPTGDAYLTTSPQP